MDVQIFFWNTAFVAPTVAEILLKWKSIFSWAGKATNGSSCQPLEKKTFMKKMEAKGGRSLLEKIFLFLKLTEIGEIMVVFDFQ